MENLKISFNRIGDADLINKDIFSVGGVLKLFLVWILIAFYVYNLFKITLMHFTV